MDVSNPFQKYPKQNMVNILETMGVSVTDGCHYYELATSHECGNKTMKSCHNSSPFYCSSSTSCKVDAYDFYCNVNLF